jgi:hypothetical protein
MTLNQTIKVFQSFAQNHRQINSFGFGRIQDYATSGDIKYPSMWLDITDDSSLSENDLETPFQIYFIDRMQKGGTTYQEVLSDMKEVALDLVRYIDSPDVGTLYINNRSATMSVIGDPSQDDEVAGWILKLSVKSFESFDSCAIPFKGTPPINTEDMVVTIVDQDGNIIAEVSCGGSYLVTSLTTLQDTIDSNTTTIIEALT